MAQLLVFVVLGRPDERMAGQDDAAEHEQDSAHAEDAETREDENLDRQADQADQEQDDLELIGGAAQVMAPEEEEKCQGRDDRRQADARAA